MNNTLEIKIVNKKKLFYDIGPYGFHFLPIIFSTICIYILIFSEYDFLSIYIISIIILFILKVFVFRNMYGNWLINYAIIGDMIINSNTIIIKSNNSQSAYDILDLKKIQLKLDFYQNYSRSRDIIHDGIGSIQIDTGIKKLPIIYFLIENKSQLEEFNNITKMWKQSGLSIWT